MIESDIVAIYYVASVQKGLLDPNTLYIRTKEGKLYKKTYPDSYHVYKWLEDLPVNSDVTLMDWEEVKE